MTAWVKPKVPGPLFPFTTLMVFEPDFRNDSTPEHEQLFVNIEMGALAVHMFSNMTKDTCQTMAKV